MPSYLRGWVTIFGLTFGVYRLFLVGVSLAVTLLLVGALEYTRFGAQVRAAVDNQRMARGLGINVDGAFALPSRLAQGSPVSAARLRSRSSDSIRRSRSLI